MKLFTLLPMLFLFATSTVVYNCKKTDSDYRPLWTAPDGTVCARARQTEPGHQWTAYPVNGEPMTFATKALAVAYIESKYCSTEGK